ncbi:Uncharacterised protein (plasmid) [Tsukamurella tyrosinosolvens]|uniref:hypothetical protein n=1 Tax=Tsukamurella tyrosinosolvens TaxID=57704 RepID=UPI000F6FBE9B|nr:hypothetical protein [Tsukamurella tyrosinosolvens]VEH94079.1 Uncharacterised protein [Tsukamurella tyrosinosolvens]
MSLIDSNWNDSVDSIRDTSRHSGIDIGEDQLPGAYLETDGELTVGVVEYLHFATERGDLNGLLTEENWLTEEGLAKAEAAMRKLLKDAGVPGRTR